MKKSLLVIVSGLTLTTRFGLTIAQENEMSFFLTSGGPGNGANLGGITGADAHCAALANTAD
jgi:hypothetical protein